MAKRVENTGVEVAALRPVTGAIRRGGGSVRTARGGDCLAWARLWRSSAAALSPAQVRLGSHWSRIIEAGLSLVETFITHNDEILMFMVPAILCHKTL